MACNKNSKCARTEDQLKVGGYCGRVILDAGIEFLARPVTPSPPPKHSALTKFMQRIFGKECPQPGGTKEACKNLQKRCAKKSDTKCCKKNKVVGSSSTDESCSEDA